MSPNRVLDSNGPDMKVRGSAAHITEKYRQLARDANAAGDRVVAENYLQHAEHYLRLLASMQEHSAVQRTSQQASSPQPDSRDDRRGGEDRDARAEGSDEPANTPDQPDRRPDPQAASGQDDEPSRSDRPGVNGGDDADEEITEKRASTRRPARRAPKSAELTDDGESAPKPRRRPRKAETAKDKPVAEIETVGEQLPGFISGKNIS